MNLLDGNDRTAVVVVKSSLVADIIDSWTTMSSFDVVPPPSSLHRSVNAPLSTNKHAAIGPYDQYTIFSCKTFVPDR